MKTNWKYNDKRFVAFLDILGFRDLVMRNTHEDVNNKMLKISYYLEQFNYTESDKAISKKYNDAGIYSGSFSDSIFIFSKNDTKENFDLFTILTSLLFSKSFKNEIPMTGAIAYGQITVIKSKQIYFGQPIIDAYLLHEEVDYLGIVAHNTIDEYLKNNNPETKDRYFEIKTPLKCGKITHLNLDWFGNIQNGNGEDIQSSVSETLNCLMKKTSGRSRRYYDNTVYAFEEINKTKLK
jgi:hypothetical protein